MRRHIAAIVTSLLLLTGCYDSHLAPSDFAPLDTPNTTIAALRNEYNNSDTEVVTSQRIISGHVVSCDAEGNHYRLLFMDDGTGGAKVLTGLYNNYADFPQGLLISLNLQGCAITMQQGTLTIGMPSIAPDAAPDYFNSPESIWQHFRRSSTMDSAEAITTTIDALSIDLCGRLVAIEGLRHTPDTEGVEEATMSGRRTFCDERGDSIYCQTSPYATFAEQPIPEGPVAITGILDIANTEQGITKYIIIPNAWSDIRTAGGSAALRLSE